MINVKIFESKPGVGKGYFLKKELITKLNEFTDKNIIIGFYNEYDAIINDYKSIKSNNPILLNKNMEELFYSGNQVLYLNLDDHITDMEYTSLINKILEYLKLNSCSKKLNLFIEELDRILLEDSPIFDLESTYNINIVGTSRNLISSINSKLHTNSRVIINENGSRGSVTVLDSLLIG